MTGLEWFLPEVLAEIHSEWTGESLDGIYSHIAHKSGEGEAEIYGLCIPAVRSNLNVKVQTMEGTNTKIQAMKRQAYGFRDHEFFKLKILGIHETKHALVG